MSVNGAVGVDYVRSPEPAGEDFVLITAKPLPLGSLAAKVVCPTAGGIASFIGTTRDNFDGKRVLKLEYEAYQPMADREIRRIIKRLRARWSVRHVAVAHRVGVVPVAEASVEIAVSSTHRKEALEAVLFAIDELKAQVPIWKKEVYEGAPSDWKANKEWEPRGSAGDAESARAPPGNGPLFASVTSSALLVAVGAVVAATSFARRALGASA